MSVFGWGSNRFGELGSVSKGTSTCYEPAILDSFDGQLAIECASGEGHSLVLTEAGQVYSFGKGTEGQLGLDQKVGVWRKPQHVQSLQNETIVKVAAGARSSFAVTASGNVYTWGLIHIDEPRADDINTGDLTGFAHDRSENVVTVDQEARQAQAAGSRTVRSRPIAPRHVRDIVKDSTEKWMAANKDDDEEYFNEMQAIGYMKEGVEEKMQHRANEYSGMLLMHTRRHPQLSPQLITSMLKIRIVSVSAGYAHSMLLSDLGRLYSSGYNDRGQLGLGHRISTSLFKPVDYLEGKMVLKVVCGHQHTLCIAIDRARAASCQVSHVCSKMSLSNLGGVLYSWGNGVLGQLGLGLRGTSKGRVLPTVVDTLFDLYPNQIRDVSAGANFSAAVTLSGKVFSWGHGEYNQHGSGASAFDYVDHFYYFYPRLLEWPVAEADTYPVQIVSIECGDNFTLAISDLGEVYSWGWHDFGVLGHGKGYFKPAPSQITALNPARTGGKVQAISCGTNHAFAVVTCGSEFSKAFADLVNDKSTADAAIVVELWDLSCGYTEQLIYCHKAILAARCRYFRGYLCAHESARAVNCDGTVDNEIIVDDDSIGNRRIVKIYLDILKLSEITVYALLDYLYTDKFTVTSHKRAALGQLAQFVGLTDLADACRSFGITHIQRSTFESDVRWMAQDPMFADIAFKSSKVLGASHSLPLTAKLSTNHSISDIDNDFIEHSIIGFSHSFVLKRIPFFENLLSGNYMETKVIFNSRELREINLDDVMLEGARNEVFFKILTYTYSGFLSSLNTEDVNEIIELLVTSNRLGIVRLSAFCEKEVALHLADYPENAENVLDFAREWNFPRLIQQCRFYKTKLGDNADLGGVLPG